MTDEIVNIMEYELVNGNEFIEAVFRKNTNAKAHMKHFN